MDKKVLYTAIKPTGTMTLGNFIGLGQDLKDLTEKYDSYICVADLHALTINLDKDILRDNIYGIISFYLALGLDPDKIVLYVQSQVKAHAEMSWVLNNFTSFGEASRMTQFKDYQAKSKDVNAGLFEYPILMAGDILLYDADIVPVGIDQKQHVELCRNIAIRFNNKIGETFTVPDVLVKKEGNKIYGLQDPEHKMSKSEKGDTGSIFIDDPEEVIRKKIKRAVTDSEGKIYYDKDNKPGISNLLTIYACLKGITVAEAEEHFKEANYGTLKGEVADVVCEKLLPIQAKYFEYKNNKEYLHEIMRKGAERASVVASKKVKEVYEKLGLITLD